MKSEIDASPHADTNQVPGIQHGWVECSKLYKEEDGLDTDYCVGETSELAKEESQME